MITDEQEAITQSFKLLKRQINTGSDITPEPVKKKII